MVMKMNRLSKQFYQVYVPAALQLIPKSISFAAKLDGKMIEMNLRNGVNIFINRDTWGGGEQIGQGTNTDVVRRRFIVTWVGGDKVEFDLADNRNVYVNKGNSYPYLKADVKGTSSNICEVRRQFTVIP